MRAYAKTAKLAIQEAGIVDYVKKSLFLLDFSYEKTAEVEQIIYKNGDEIIEKGYNDRVTYKVSLSENSIRELKEKKRCCNDRYIKRGLLHLKLCSSLYFKKTKNQ